MHTLIFPSINESVLLHYLTPADLLPWNTTTTKHEELRSHLKKSDSYPTIVERHGRISGYIEGHIHRLHHKDYQHKRRKETFQVPITCIAKVT